MTALPDGIPRKVGSANTLQSEETEPLSGPAVSEMDDDFLVLIEDEETDGDLDTTSDDARSGATDTACPYLVLVVDDDSEVHAVTKMVLANFNFGARNVHILSAHSALEARSIMAAEPDIAVVFLDVVMETDNAGLELVRWIREDLGNTAVRVVLRTGQPGQSPEKDIILRYDVNDYKSKTELTETKLVTSLVASLRSFDQICELNASRAALLQAANTLEQRVEERTQALTASEHRLRSILDASLFPVLILSLEQNNRVVFVNDWAAEQLGRPLDQVLGAYDTLLWVDQAARSALLRKLGAHGRVSGEEVELKGPDDKPFWALISAILIEYEDKPAILITFTDISTRKKFEEDLKRQATTDSLTGIANRRHFLDRAAAEIKRSRRFKQPLSLVLFDIDHFKHINDTYGHQTGDAVLCDMTEAVGNALREIDLVGRMGGEEFAVILPGTSMAAAALAADRMRAVIGGVQSRVENENLTVRVTASFGVSELSGPDDRIEAMMHRADEALYLAKGRGRNRVEMAASLPAPEDGPVAQVEADDSDQDDDGFPHGHVIPFRQE